MRYYTKGIKNAFYQADLMNNFENEKKWRVGARVSEYVVLDTDTDNVENVRTITNYYEKLFGYLRTYKTNHGYHLYSKKLEDIKYQRCRVLNPLLKKEETNNYILLVKNWLRRQKVEKREGFAEYVQNKFPQSGLYCGIGDFDIYFAMLPLIRGYYIVRISKKSENDNPHEIK